MKRKHKNWKFGFLGYRILVRISYPAKRKIPRTVLPAINKKAFLIYYIALFALMFGFFIKGYFNNSAYVTRNFQLTQDQGPKEQIVFHGARNTKKVALTFDADMTPTMRQDLELGNVQSYYDNRAIEILKKTKTKATLFLTGMWIEQYTAVAKELYINSLFELGNHSYSHPGFDGECFGLTPITDSKDQEEIQRTQKLLKNITKTDNKLFRFPGGCYSQIDLDAVSKEGLISIQWDAVGEDGFNGSMENIRQNVIDSVQNGSIIVLHMNGYPNEPETANALPDIISNLRQRGFEFVTVSELLNIKRAEKINIMDYIND